MHGVSDVIPAHYPIGRQLVQLRIPAPPGQLRGGRRGPGGPPRSPGVLPPGRPRRRARVRTLRPSLCQGYSVYRHIHISTWMHTYNADHSFEIIPFTYIHTYIHAYKHTCKQRENVHINACLQTVVHAFIHKCVHTCVHTYTYSTHTKHFCPIHVS